MLISVPVVGTWSSSSSRMKFGYVVRLCTMNAVSMVSHRPSGVVTSRVSACPPSRESASSRVTSWPRCST